LTISGLALATLGQAGERDPGRARPTQRPAEYCLFPHCSGLRHGTSRGVVWVRFGRSSGDFVRSVVRQSGSNSSWSVGTFRVGFLLVRGPETRGAARRTWSCGPAGRTCPDRGLSEVFRTRDRKAAQWPVGGGEGGKDGSVPPFPPALPPFVAPAPGGPSLFDRAPGKQRRAKNKGLSPPAGPLILVAKAGCLPLSPSSPPSPPLHFPPPSVTLHFEACWCGALGWLGTTGGVWRGARRARGKTFSMGPGTHPTSRASGPVHQGRGGGDFRSSGNFYMRPAGNDGLAGGAWVPAE